jgi:hypothetical protein
MKQTRFLSLIVVCMVTLFFSCTKETNIAPEATDQKTSASAKPKAATVDVKLLREYNDYALHVRKRSLTKQPFSYSEVEIARFRAEKFDKMIDNYLLNERNLLIQKHILKRDGVVAFGPGDPPQTIYSGSATVSGSLGTMNVYAQMVTNTGSTTISNSSFSWGGLHGDMKAVGTLEQSYSQGVLTYKQVYSETVSKSGVNYTSHLAVYGNIYGGQMTVNAMPIAPP